jgi:hypothetical protein
LNEPIARYSGDIVQWCFHKIRGEDNEWFNTTKRALVDKPRVFTERCPNLVWVIGYRAVHPKDEFKDWGAIETQDDRQIFKVTVNQFILQRLIPEKQIALVVEQMDDPSVQWQAASVDVAEGKLARSATKLGISLAVHNLVSLSSVYEAYPVHCFDVNPLVHILWQFGTIKASAFLSLLDSTEPDLFLHYPNLSLAKFLLDNYHICRALRISSSIWLIQAPAVSSQTISILLSMRDTLAKPFKASKPKRTPSLPRSSTVLVLRQYR